MSEKILIIGGAGFIGSHLCDALLDRGNIVRVFDRPGIVPYRVFKSTESIEWVQGDFNSEIDIEKAVTGCKIIFHLISTTLPKSSNEDPVYDIQSNVIGTVRLLDIARRAAIEKLVFVSSGGTVYGIPNEIPISESHPTNPLSSYGISKLAIEKYLKLYELMYGLKYSIIRLANPYGARQRTNGAQGAVAVFMEKAIKNEEINIWGDGSVVRDYIYISDVIDALLSVANYYGGENVFNIGSGQGKNLNQILQEIELILHRPVLRSYTESRSFDVPVNVLDIELAKKILDWSPKISFDEGLSKTYEWLNAEMMGKKL